MSEPVPAGEMTLVEHLAEFRTRFLRAFAALIVGAVVGFVLFPWVLEVLVQPYCTANEILRPGRPCNLVALRPLEPFSVRWKTSLVIGLMLGGPVIFYQLWRFITPGLTRRERRYALPFVVLSMVLFAFGLVFAYLIIPQGLRILLGMAGGQVETFLSADEYLSFFLTTSVAFGLVFELPLVLTFLSLVGVVKASGLRKARPYAIVGLVSGAAVITPPDAATLVFMAVPLIAFYELSILAAWLIERSRRTQVT